MNEHDQEDDWIRLGQSLRDYQPAGRPDQDFAAFQVLQNAERRSPRRLLAWLGLAMMLLMAGTMFFLQPFESASQQQAVEAPTDQRTNQLAQTFPQGQVAATSLKPDLAGQAAGTNVPETKPGLRPQLNENSLSTPLNLPEFSPENLFTTVRTPPLPALARAEEVAVEATSSGGGVANGLEVNSGKAGITPAVSFPDAKESEAVLVNSLSWPVVALVNEPTVTPAEVEGSAAALKPVGRHAVITFNTGLSTHWRGSTFLAEPDQGIYFSVGAQQRIGRFSLGGRFGYRGHNMNLEVLEGEAKPWSHYEDKTNEFNDELGEEIEYTYVGVVNGYKGVEFSLLLGYHLSPKALLQVGGRYSLPSLEIRRTVHSSHDGDVTHQPNPYHFFATEQPLVKYHDYGALLGGQYRVGKHLSLEAMLHLGMVDLIEDEGERMNRFNHSSSVSIGISYRLH